jgi:hypothetical protein
VGLMIGRRLSLALCAALVLGALTPPARADDTSLYRADPAGRIEVESVTGSSDAIAYRLRRGRERLNLTLYRLPTSRVLVLSGEDRRVRAVATQVTAPGRSGGRYVFIAEFRKGQRPANTFAQAVVDARFLATLPAPEQPGEFSWKGEFDFVGDARTGPPRSTFFVSELPADTAPGSLPEVSDFFCAAPCQDPLCTACLQSQCELFQCLERESARDPQALVGRCSESLEALKCGRAGR